MAISVVIPSKNIDNLTACMGAAREHQAYSEFVIVDDGLDMSRAGSLFEYSFSFADVIAGEKPFIFARNVNIGIRRALAQAEIDGVVLLNDDALLQTPGGFQKLAQFAEAHPGVGVVAPSTNVTGQPLQWPKHRTPSGYRFVDCVPYVCVYLPRRTLDRVGLLDERYCLDYGMEDRDHCEAITRAGLKIAVNYDVYVDHGSLRSSFRGDPKQPKSFQQNYALFKAKWGIR